MFDSPCHKVVHDNYNLLFSNPSNSNRTWEKFDQTSWSIVLSPNENKPFQESLKDGHGKNF
jgi:hypothetical protein